MLSPVTKRACSRLSGTAFHLIIGCRLCGRSGPPGLYELVAGVPGDQHVYIIFGEEPRFLLGAVEIGRARIKRPLDVIAKALAERTRRQSAERGRTVLDLDDATEIGFILAAAHLAPGEALRFERRGERDQEQCSRENRCLHLFPLPASNRITKPRRMQSPERRLSE